jgi:enoyl-CoA hydratase/carnithine racemase
VLTGLDIYNNSDGTLLIQFNQPEKMNGLDNRLLRELWVSLNEAAIDSKVKAIVLTGGEKVFTAGGDLQFLSKLDQLGAAELCELVQKVVMAMRTVGKPVIAAVGGHAIGGGLELALAADIIIASENAKLGLTQLNLGIIPGAGGTHTLINMIGLNRTRYMIYTGELFDAETALKWGMISKIVSQDEVIPEALKLAGKLAVKAPIALSLAKKNVNQATYVDFYSSMQFEQQAWGFLFSTQDQSEGFKAFLEKRKPCFQGK